AWPRSLRDRDRAAILAHHRPDSGGGGEALHGLRPGRASQVARLYRPRSRPAGGCQPGGLARPHPEKVAGLARMGVDHACALMIPADSMAEFEDQVEWFAKIVLT